MPRTLFSFTLVALILGSLAGCDAKPSTEIAPDVKAPDTSGMTKEEVLKLRDGGSGPRDSETKQ